MFALALSAPGGRAQDAPLDSLLRAHRTTLALADGALVGPGAEFLLSESRRAHIVVLGEEHGVADVPELAGALFRALRPAGYEHLALEVSPTTGAALDRLARGGRDSLAAFFGRHPLAVPFYDWHEEAQLLVDAVADAGPDPVIWGVDYEFIFAPAFLMGEFAQRATTDEARALVRALRQRAEGDRDAAAAGEWDRMLLARLTPDDLAALDEAFAGDAEAVALVRSLEASAEVWRLQLASDNYGSNLARTALLRRTFAEAYRRARGDREVGPKVLVKVGAFHGFRGRTPLHILDVGTMAAMLADAEGGRSFHVIALAGPGTEQATFTPTGPGTSPVEPPPWAAPLYAAADDERWTVFDLRPLRPALYDGRLDVDDELERLVWGYDAVLILVGSRPASFDALPQ